MKENISILALALGLGCGRATSSYDVHVYAEGTSLDELSTDTSLKNGVIEYARFRMWGRKLGLGITGLYGDTPYISSTQFVLSSAKFGYPAHPSFDTQSFFISPNTTVDTCYSIIGPRSEASSTDYVDVGDSIRLRGETVDVSLQRDPTNYPRPAGEIWYVGYSAGLGPVLQNYAHGKDTWPTSATTLQVITQGGLPPEDSMIPAIPYGFIGELGIPASLENIAINGTSLDANSEAFTWADSLQFTWTPSTNSGVVQIAIRYLGTGSAQDDCSCDEDCGEDLTCVDGGCMATEGSSDHQLAELVCTVADDGNFTLTSSMLPSDLTNIDAQGWLLLLSRMEQKEITAPDIISHNRKRLQNYGIRTRGIDTVVTRLEKP